jgi:hypothetical protein
VRFAKFRLTGGLRYGTKINRIRDMQQDILRDERYWFVEKQDKK